MRALETCTAYSTRQRQPRNGGYLPSTPWPTVIRQTSASTWSRSWRGPRNAQKRSRSTCPTSSPPSPRAKRSQYCPRRHHRPRFQPYQQPRDGSSVAGGNLAASMLSNAKSKFRSGVRRRILTFGQIARPAPGARTYRRTGHHRRPISPEYNSRKPLPLQHAPLNLR